MTSESDYRFLPVTEAVSPAGGTFFRHVVNCWWIAHPGSGLAFWNPQGRNGERRQPDLGTPQYNPDEHIARTVLAATAASWADIQFISSAWIPVDVNDYKD
jgi:hypothetical protein